MTIAMALYRQTNDFTRGLTESCLGLVMGFILMLELHSSLLRRGINSDLKQMNAQVAELVDALVSGTSG